MKGSFLGKKKNLFLPLLKDTNNLCYFYYVDFSPKCESCSEETNMIFDEQEEG